MIALLLALDIVFGSGGTTATPSYSTSIQGSINAIPFTASCSRKGSGGRSVSGEMLVTCTVNSVATMLPDGTIKTSIGVVYFRDYEGPFDALRWGSASWIDADTTDDAWLDEEGGFDNFDSVVVTVVF